MLPDYNDIRSRIDAEPIWYDSNGVPRYDFFKPEMLGVYDHFALLVQIKCQSCGYSFLVGEGWAQYDFYWGQDQPVQHDLDALVDRYHYGDPPAHGCVGDSMNCIDVEVLGAWERTSAGAGWAMKSGYSGRDLRQEWAK